MLWGDFFLMAAVVASVAHYGGENGPGCKEGEQLPLLRLSHGKENPAPFPAAGGYAGEVVYDKRVNQVGRGRTFAE